MGQLRPTLLLLLIVYATQSHGSKMLDHFIEDIIYKWKLLSPTLILSEDGDSAPDICMSGKSALCLQNEQGSTQRCLGHLNLTLMIA